jgi:CheY-like chemotaxis protein
MSQEVVERVFEPFFTTKSSGEGTGLGLAIAWGIIQQHGGMVNCSSEVGVGTRFDVYLPVGDHPASETARYVTGAAPRGSERILVADDQPEVRAVLTRLLTEAGYSVVGVGNGAAAVTAASKESFDLYILDAVMPVVGGRKAYELIIAGHPHARFLFTSGYDGDVLPASFLASSHVEVISKPFEPTALLRAVRASLDEGK